MQVTPKEKSFFFFPPFMTKACMMPLQASFKIRKIAARIGTFASVENRTGNCHMFKILCLTSNFKLPNSTGMPKE